MNFEEISELFTQLQQAKLNNAVEWECLGKTRYRTNWNGQEIEVDRRNNIDKDVQEIYLKVEDFENTYSSNTEEFDFLVKFIERI
ncbi:hypothetical protein [uncultured Maribacter sp.]|uniref:hypothetical protein n=1 Tax=uncultured Maribacter sp. TaxID=431308 RepID=UPI0030DBF0FC|tara:strand:+ start:9802 stop:10056 length:255 start_codon:yes stop_codon:yes gene_type:complete